MGQIGIAALNKVGYSMYWNSMWDNNIQYSKNLKESIFLSKFFNSIFNDNVSFKFIKLKNLKKRFILKSELDNQHFYSKSNSIKQTNSKVWVLKYQKWVLIFMFIYVFNNSIKLFSNFSFKKSNFFYNNIYKNYFMSLYSFNSTKNIKNNLYASF